MTTKQKLQQVLLGVKLLHDRSPHKVGTEPVGLSVSDVGLKAITQFVNQTETIHIYGSMVQTGIRDQDMNTFLDSGRKVENCSKPVRLKICHSGEVYLEIGEHSYWIKEDYSIKYLDLIPCLIKMEAIRYTEFAKIRTKLSQWVKMETVSNVKSKLETTLLLALF